jgi:small-conductance mechanosensitive channel
MSEPSSRTRRAHGLLGGPAELRRSGRRDLFFGVVFVVVTLVALGAGSYGKIHTNRVEPRVVAFSAAAGFVVFGVLATRALARSLSKLMTSRTARAAGMAVRVVVAAVGYLVVLFGFLGMLGVSLGHLLIGGTVAGVVLGIAGQQSLSNVFAGFVLLLARPFTIGDHVRVRSGALNGPFEGVVLGVSLTYVTLFVDGGVLKIPNSAVLAAGVGLYPAKDRSVVEGARAAGAPFTPPQGTLAVPGPAPGGPASGPEPSQGSPPSASGPGGQGGQR